MSISPINYVYLLHLLLVKLYVDELQNVLYVDELRNVYVDI